jgi:hypothetical protein
MEFRVQGVHLRRASAFKPLFLAPPLLRFRVLGIEHLGIGLGLSGAHGSVAVLLRLTRHRYEVLQRIWCGHVLKHRLTRALREAHVVAICHPALQPPRQSHSPAALPLNEG